mgnify:CR=1 FL=1
MSQQVEHAKVVPFDPAKDAAAVEFPTGERRLVIRAGLLVDGSPLAEAEGLANRWNAFADVLADKKARKKRWWWF